MNPNKLLFDRILDNDELVGLLKQMNVANWSELSIFEREELFSSIMKKIFNLFEETSKFSLKYEYVDRLNGEFIDDTCFINGEAISDDNPYNALFYALHEYRHGLQNIAEFLYQKKGIIFEAFSEDEIKDFIVNDRESCITGACNYIESGRFDHYEYVIQPVEYDADKFAYQFLENVMKKINCNEEDTIYIEDSKCLFTDNMGNITYSENDIINFGKIYRLNYEDYVSDNLLVFDEENEILNKYTYLKDNLKLVDKDQIYCLFIPSFWEKFDLDEKAKIINRYFELYNYDIEASVEGCMFIDDESISTFNSFEVLERMFNVMAQRELVTLSQKAEIELSDNEKLILFNLKKENRIIEENNPLIYHIQPYMIFTHNFVLEHSKKFYSVLEKTFNSENNYFDYYKKIYCDNDVESMIKKVKAMTGDTPLAAYKKALKQKPKVFRKSLLV